MVYRVAGPGPPAIPYIIPKPVSNASPDIGPTPVRPIRLDIPVVGSRVLNSEGEEPPPP